MNRLNFTAFAVATLVCVGASASGDDLSRISEDVTRLGVKVKTATEDYLRADVLDGLRPFTARLADAEVMYLLADYPRASLVLFDLVSDKNNANEPSYGNCVYYLAESFFQIGTYLSSRDYFEQVIQRRDKDHMKDAIRRLIQIGDRTERWDGIAAQVKVLEEQGPLPPDIAYIQAKSLLRQGKGADARDLVEQIPHEHPLYLKAAYLGAVAALKTGNYEDALHRFDAVTPLGGSYDDSTEVRDLALMNEGRILFEQGKLEEASVVYQRIPQESPHFEEALYELTWAYLRAAEIATEEGAKKENYTRAKNSLELLLVTASDAKLAPEARLLLGNIMLRLQNYDDATTSFSDVVDLYAPVRDELASLSKQITDPLQYYEEVANRSRRGDGLLPPLAVRWAASTDSLQQALSVVHDVDTIESWVRESEDIVNKLVAVLESEKRSQFFPALRDAQAAHVTLQNNLTALSQRLLNVEREILQDYLDEAGKAELAKVLAERKTLESEYQRLPQNREEYTSHVNASGSRMRDVESSAYKLRYPLKTMTSELDAMRSWLSQNPDKLSRTDARDFRERMAQQEREINELAREQQQLESEVSREKSMMSVSLAAQQHDDDLREHYTATLDKEREILAMASARAPASKQGELAQIEQHRSVLANYYAELKVFEDKLETIVAAKSRDLKTEVLREMALLDGNMKAVEEMRTAAKQVVGGVAAQALGSVQDKFYDLVLRADVGIVDVAWQLKEEETAEISRRVNEQHKELQLLDTEFEEVLNEE